jgi:SAM-dependent methyltransferase
VTRCRACGGAISAPDYEAPSPALTSILTLLDVPTRVYVCQACGHTQNDDIPEIQAFYDTGYRISLASEDHDQVFAIGPDGAPIYRTDHQAAISLNLLDLPPSAAVLDYGAARSDTLRKMVARRPDLRPHVFDVSSDYAPAWQGWVQPEAQATYAPSASWAGRFDAAMSHFVIEHVADPQGFVRDIGALLRPGGSLLLSMPDVDANPGDLVVADHLNHFSEVSLRRILAASGFRTTTVDRTSFPGAFFLVATKTEDVDRNADDHAAVALAARRAQDICVFWRQASDRIAQEAERWRGAKAAIYGAGFYGSWLYGKVGSAVRVSAFLDRNPKLRGATHFGLPVMLPEDIAAETEVLFIGLNPLKAREAIAAQPWLQRAGLTHIWI